jgi:hypothetical protein
MIRTIIKILIFILLSLIVAFVWHFYFPANHQKVFPEYENWDNGKVAHILPAANHHQFLIKVSFKEAMEAIPILYLSDTIQVEGKSLDRENRFWEFYVKDLSPNSNYSLQLASNKHEKLADSWSLKTYPHPDSMANELTILAFTCAGGIKERVLNQELFLKTEWRHLLLKKGLSFSPDIIIANGDHIYWDRQTMDNGLLKRLAKLRLDNIYGHLDLSKPMGSGANYKIISKIADAQIAELYGCLLRSTPVYFLPDDHDLLENDEATADLTTLPPDDYGIDAHHTIQDLYYPDFLPDRQRPIDLPGKKEDRNRNYGTLRYGKLVEAVLFDCKRHTSLAGEAAVLTAKEAENWIINRTQNSQTNFLIHIPSTPIGWTAGKWSEWYPDVFQSDGTIGLGETKKYKWQKGWWLQHQRLLKSWQNTNHIPIILQGDLHNSSYALLRKSGDLDFQNNPIHAIGTGTLGSGKLGFPSSFRGTGALVPKNLEVEEQLKPIEKNGFSIIQIKADQIKVSMYNWRPEDGVETIKALEPFLVKRIHKDRQ